MVPITSAAEATARDAAAIESGIPSRALMQRAGAAAAAEIARAYRDRLAHGVLVFAGPGNNGGDAWVVARALHAVGVRVCAHAVGESGSADARAERDLAQPLVRRNEPTGSERLVVDGLLGTGATGEPRGEIGKAISQVRAIRERGAIVVALDTPSGVDSTTGSAASAVIADLTLTFGTMKRGLLIARANCGRIQVLDIGLAPMSQHDVEPMLIDRQWVANRVPRIAVDAHKGQRKRLAIVGGGLGMAGAAILAARAAMRSGIGIVRLFMAPDSVAVAQNAAPEALAKRWPDSNADVENGISQWAHGVVLGPGLGKSSETRALAERVLAGWHGPVVVDADALNVFEGDATALGSLLAGRPALLTPHVSECGRLLGVTTKEIMANRFDVGVELARTTNAAVLLKGVPTVLTAPDGRRLVSAAGSPVLGVAGSGDLLAGIAGTLITQCGEAFETGAAAAWIHGRAGELAARGRSIRGVTLERILCALSRAWRLTGKPARYPVLAELPQIEVEDGR